MDSQVGKPCLVCGKPSAYKRVRHCKKCHSEYNKMKYEKTKQSIEYWLENVWRNGQK
jgi:hypothetical protein